MSNCKTTPTPVITGLQLIKDDDGSIVDLRLFKRLVGNIMYLTTKIPDIMYGLSNKYDLKIHGVTERISL